MDHDQTFRIVLIIGSLLVFPVGLYHRVKSQATGESLDRWQEGAFILFTLRPIGLATMAALLLYMVDPSLMAWSSMPLPLWLRWTGVGIGVVGGALVIWAFRSLGSNLTDTVVTRRQHTLITGGPYRWVRHPFYDAVACSIVANALGGRELVLAADGRRRLAADPAANANRGREADRAVRRRLSRVYGTDRAVPAEEIALSARARMTSRCP